jgi:hypothetical protein
MNKINYLEILKHSWQITWYNKYLWWFGFFLALGSGGSFNFGWPSEDGTKKQSEQQMVEALNAFLNKYWEYILAGIIILLIIILVLAVLKIICRAGIIKSVQKIIAGEGTSFKAGFVEGKKYFWKLLFLGLIVGLFVIGSVLVLISPVILLIFIKAYAWSIIFGILALFIIIFLAILAAYLKEYANLYLVLSNIGIRSALENAFSLFKNNLGSSIIFSLVIMAVGIVFGMAILMFLVMAVLVFLALGLLIYAIFAKTGAIMVAVFGGAAALVSILFLQSVFETFRQTSWILFFRKIAAVKIEEKIEEKETAEVVEKVLEGGEA